MSEGGKSGGTVAGLTTFFLLAFILPGFVYVCFVVLLFDLRTLLTFLPQGTTFGADIAIGMTVFFGLTITSIAFSIEIVIRWLLSLLDRKSSRRAQRASLSQLIFSIDRQKELGWYFWQLWGQTILHFNIWVGLSAIYLLYKWTAHEMWPWCLWFSSWRDFTLPIILANVVCWIRFSTWFAAVISQLRAEIGLPAPAAKPH
jgi:hypothetical protein